MIFSAAKYVRLDRTSFIYEEYIPSRDKLILVETGEFSLRCGDEEVIVRAGEGALFLKGKKYYRYVIKPCRLHLFGFESNDILFPQMHIVFRNKKRVLSDINMLNMLYDDLYSDNFEYISNIFSDLVNLYNFENCGTNLKANFSDKAVTDSLAFINNNFSERFSLAQLAEKCEISNSQFIRRFKAATGITPSEYLLKVRLSHAKQLLLNSDLLIKEIAQLCGFENEYYFSNFFKRNMKLSPKNYRKMYMNF